MTPAINPIHQSWAPILTDPVRLAVLHGLCDLGTATIAQLRERCHSSDPSIRRHLESLEALDLVREQPGEPDGLTPGRPARSFTLNAEAATMIWALFRLLGEPVAPAARSATGPRVTRTPSD